MRVPLPGSYLVDFNWLNGETRAGACEIGQGFFPEVWVSATSHKLSFTRAARRRRAFEHDFHNLLFKLYTCDIAEKTRKFQIEKFFNRSHRRASHGF